MASWSRLLDSIGWIWHALAAVASAVLLRWRELWQADELKLGISVNKAVFPSLYLMRPLASGGGVGAVRFCGMFPWWELQWRRLAQGTFNKLAVWALSMENPSFLPVPCRRSDGEEGDEQAWVDPVAVAQREGGARADLRAQDAATMPTCGVPQRRHLQAAAILGQRDHSALGWMPEHLLPPWRRIIKDLHAGITAGAAPSGKLPDCIYIFLLQGLLCNMRGPRCTSYVL